MGCKKLQLQDYFKLIKPEHNQIKYREARFKTDFKGQVTEFIYDYDDDSYATKFGRLMKTLYYPADSSTVAETVTYSYDNLGRQYKITKSVGDTVKRITEYSYNALGQLSSVNASTEGTVNYEYNPITGQKIRTWTTSGNTDTSYEYDDLGRLETVIDLNGAATNYTYTEVGSRDSVELPNGIITEYTYNNLNRLTKLAHFDADDNLLSSYDYTLAPNGRRTAVAEQSRTAAPALSPLYNRNITYTYDKLNRLVAETSTCDDTNQPELTYNSEYSYDLTGNRKNYSVTNDSVTTAVAYTYNANDQLIDEKKFVSGNDAVITHYEYDTNGSLISKITADGDSYVYTYNLQNRLSRAIIDRIENGNSVAITSDYVYNTGGIRVKANSVVNGVEHNRTFLLDAGLTGYAQVLEEKNNDGDVIKSYILGDDVLADSGSYLLYDGHGSTRLLIENSTGNPSVIAQYNYDAYGMMLGGNPLSTTNQAATDLLYSGEQFDTDLQMQYLRARYYDQNNGTFNRLDPFNGNMGDPQSLHKYAYCHGNPVNGIDPSGNISLTNVMTSLSIVAWLNVIVGSSVNLKTFVSSALNYEFKDGKLFDAFYITLGAEFGWKLKGNITGGAGISHTLVYIRSMHKWYGFDTAGVFSGSFSRGVSVSIGVGFNIHTPDDFKGITLSSNGGFSHMHSIVMSDGLRAIPAGIEKARNWLIASNSGILSGSANVAGKKILGKSIGASFWTSNYFSKGKNTFGFGVYYSPLSVINLEKTSRSIDYNQSTSYSWQNDSSLSQLFNDKLNPSNIESGNFIEKVLLTIKNL